MSVSKHKAGSAAAAQMRLPVQPLIAAAVLDALEKPQMYADRHVGRLVGLDPALTVAVMRMANSPHLGLSRRAASTQQSMIMLGTRAVHGLATSGTAALVLQESDPTTPRGFWARSVTTAVASANVADRIGSSVEEAFSAGMLTEIGDLLLQQRDPVGHASVRSDFGPVYDKRGLDLEIMELGRGHTEAGADQLDHWWFPQRVVRAVRLHHERPEILIDTLTRVVRCGAATMAWLHRGNENDEETLRDALRICGLTGLRLDSFRAEVEAEVNGVAADVVGAV